MSMHAGVVQTNPQAPLVYSLLPPTAAQILAPPAEITAALTAALATALAAALAVAFVTALTAALTAALRCRLLHWPHGPAPVDGICRVQNVRSRFGPLHPG